MKIDDGQFLDILSVAREHGAMTMVHAENSGMIGWMTKRLLAAGHTAPRYHAISHPALAEEEAINRAIALAKLADAPLFIVHVSTPEGAALVQRARLDGAKLFAETCPQYLFLTREALDRPGMEGAKFMCSPPPATPKRRRRSGGISRAEPSRLVSSDHAPYRYDEAASWPRARTRPSPASPTACRGSPRACRSCSPKASGAGGSRSSNSWRCPRPMRRSSTACIRARVRSGHRRRRRHRHLGSRGDPRDPAGGPARRHGLLALRRHGGQGLAGHGALARRARSSTAARWSRSPAAAASSPARPVDLTGVPGARAPETDPACAFGADILAGARA
jgi:dihydropyrimidinase